MTQEQINRVITLHEQKVALDALFQFNDSDEFNQIIFQNYDKDTDVIEEEDRIHNYVLAQVVVEALRDRLEEINKELEEL